MSHKYFTINERNKLEVLLKENYRISKIAKILDRHRATITVKSKELMANTLLRMLRQMPVQKLLIKEEAQKLLPN